MLLGFVNMKLRDHYKNLDVLCEDLNLDRGALEKKLEGIDYRYDSQLNKFI